MLAVFVLLLLGCTIRGVSSRDYKVYVTTPSSPWDAGTDASVKIKIIGTTGEFERELDNGHNNFDKGKTDLFTLSDNDDTGFVKGMQIYRDNTGILPGWNLEKVVITVDGAADGVFYYNDWVPKNTWKTLTLSCRAGHSINPQGICAVPCRAGYAFNSQGICAVYKVYVTTPSSPWDAGTDAAVKIKIIGTDGVTPERELDNGHNNFEKGNTDVFTLTEWDKGYVKGMQIYRDNSGTFPGWLLKEVVITVDGAADGVFYYNDWVPKNTWTTLTLSCRVGYAINHQGICAGHGPICSVCSSSTSMADCKANQKSIPCAEGEKCATISIDLGGTGVYRKACALSTQCAPAAVSCCDTNYCNTP